MTPFAGGVDGREPHPGRHEIDHIIEQALRAMAGHGLHGKEATPYLLGRIVEFTHGESLTANIALVNNNAALGARIATAYAVFSR